MPATPDVSETWKVMVLQILIDCPNCKPDSARYVGDVRGSIRVPKHILHPLQRRGPRFRPLMVRSSVSAGGALTLSSTSCTRCAAPRPPSIATTLSAPAQAKLGVSRTNERSAPMQTNTSIQGLRRRKSRTASTVDAPAALLAPSSNSPPRSSAIPEHRSTGLPTDSEGEHRGPTDNSHRSRCRENGSWPGR